jgi:hypothetical protein
MQTISELWKNGTYWKICLYSAILCIVFASIGFYLKPSPQKKASSGGTGSSTSVQSSSAPAKTAKSSSSGKTANTQASPSQANQANQPQVAQPLKFKAPLKADYKIDTPMVLLTWELENKDFKGQYEIWAKDGSGTVSIKLARFKEIALLAASDNEYEHRSIEYDKTYQYYVRAVDQSGSIKSSTAEIKTSAPRLPQPVLKYSYSIAEPKLILEWEKISSWFSGDVVLYRADGPAGKAFEKIAVLNQDQLRFDDSNVNFGKSYSYYIKAVNRKPGIKPVESPPLKVTVPLPSYAIPSLEARPVIRNNALQVSLNWQEDTSKSDHITGFKLFRRSEDTANDAFELLASLGIRYDSMDTTAVPGTTYIYRVTPELVNGDPGDPTETRLTLPPAPPGQINAEINAEGKTILSWEQLQAGSNPISGYRIYRFPEQNAYEFKDHRYPKYRQECLKAKIGPEKFWTDPDPLPLCKAYSYAVTAVDSKQNESTVAFLPEAIVRYQVFDAPRIDEKLSYMDSTIVEVHWISEKKQCSFGWYELDRCTDIGPDGKSCKNWQAVKACSGSQQSYCQMLRDGSEKEASLIRVRTANRGGIAGVYAHVLFEKGNIRTIEHKD